jgi:hypothetical protein
MSGIPRGKATYEEPFVWWGPVWSPPPAPTVIDLLRAGVLTPEVAALLWHALGRRRSIVVAAGPRGVGKTTLLTALLDCLPSATRRLYLRGGHETFAFLDDPTVVPADSILLVNEISAHLPAYLWGPGVRRLFQSTRRGFVFAATAHAATIEELIGQLAGYPLRVPLSELAAINVAVFLATSGGPDARWQVGEVWATAEETRRGLIVSPLAAGGELTDAATAEAPAAAEAPATGELPSAAELCRRADFLAGLARSKAVLSSGQVRRHLAEFTAGSVPATGM